MKTSEQIYKKYKNFLSAVTKEEVVRVIEQIQREAYNQALEDAAVMVRNIEDYHKVLKLKK